MDVDYCVGMGWPQSTEEAGRIMAEVIRPAMDEARSIGMAVCHVESEWMDHQYPPHRVAGARTGRGLYTRTSRRCSNGLTGVDYMRRSPLAKMRRAEVVSPQGDEPLVFYTDVLDEYLRGRGVETLIYMGFAADMCLLGAEGGSPGDAGPRLSLRRHARRHRRRGDPRELPAAAVHQLRPSHLRVEPRLRLHLRAVLRGCPPVAGGAAMSLSICPWKYGKRWVYSITYDEALADLHRFAVPMHEEYGIPGHVEILVGQMGQIRKAGNSSYNGFRHMDGEELRDLLARGWGVGNHSWSHEVITPEMVGRGDRPRQAGPGGSPRRTDHPLLLARQQHEHGRSRPRGLPPLRVPGAP